MKNVFIFDCFGVLIDETTFSPIQKGIDLLKYVHGDNKKIFMLTNAMKARMDQLKALYPDVFSCFLDIITPTESGFLKPSQEHFLYLLDKHALYAPDCFFIDDAQSNVQMALRLGMQGLIFTESGESDIKDFIQKK